MPDFTSMKGQSINIAATTTTANVALPDNYTNVTNMRIYNSGTTAAFVNSGGSTVAATTAGTFVAPGAIEILSKLPADTYVAAIMASGTGTIYFQPTAGE